MFEADQSEVVENESQLSSRGGMRRNSKRRRTETRGMCEDIQIETHTHTSLVTADKPRNSRDCWEMGD